MPQQWWDYIGYVTVLTPDILQDLIKDRGGEMHFIATIVHRQIPSYAARKYNCK